MFPSNPSKAALHVVMPDGGDATVVRNHPVGGCAEKATQVLLGSTLGGLCANNELDAWLYPECTPSAVAGQWLSKADTAAGVCWRHLYKPQLLCKLGTSAASCHT